MSEFKGTKEKWIITYPEGSNGFVYVGRRINDGAIATCYTVNRSEKHQDIAEETMANALLISKAPEMLDFINRISGEMLRNDFVLDERWHEQARQLIQEATEINKKL